IVSFDPFGDVRGDLRRYVGLAFTVLPKNTETFAADVRRCAKEMLSVDEESQRARVRAHIERLADDAARRLRAAAAALRRDVERGQADPKGLERAMDGLRVIEAAKDRALAMLADSDPPAPWYAYHELQQTIQEETSILGRHRRGPRF